MSEYRLYEYDGKQYAWPVQACSRCGGSGRYSYNSVDGDRCYGCNGKGVQVKKAAQAAATACAEAQRRRQEALAATVEVGDKVTKSWGDREYVEVVAIEETDQACGWKGTVKPAEVTAWMRLFTFADGTTERIPGNSILRRSFTKADLRALRAEYQAQIPEQVWA